MTFSLNSEAHFTQNPKKMKCSQCNLKTKVVDSGQLISKIGQPYTWRRLRCSEQHISYSHEVLESISPIEEKIRYKEQKNAAARKKKKAKPVHVGMVRQYGIKVTSDSPEWLKRIALQLE
jgi:hypothetical protein